MRKRGIRFAVASGRQYYGIAPLFQELEPDIIFITDNGSYIRHRNETIYIKKMPKANVDKIVEKLNYHGINEYVISGLNHAYVNKKGVKTDFLQSVNRYYNRQKDVADGYDTDDIFKFSVRIDKEEEVSLLKSLGESSDSPFASVSSGLSYVDLIDPTVNKAKAVKILQKVWDIADNETAVFGDSDNDWEMLTAYPFSFAVGNASERIKQCAAFTIKTNNEEGVLEVIDSILE